MMKRNVAACFLIMVVFCLAAVSFTGCAKKATVKEGTFVSEDKQAAKARADAEARRKAEEEARRRAKEQADRERAEREAAMKQKAAVAQPAAYEFADVHFDFDKYTLRSGDRDILKKHGEWLEKNAGDTVLIEGNCDERGTAEYNLALGEKRAREAKKYLVEMGIGEKRISMVSYGKERPLDPGHNEEAWAKNRRDHFVVTGRK